MITESYINKLIEQYAKSPAGRAAIKKKTGIEYVDKDPTAVLTTYGEQMKNILYKHVNALIKSITPSTNHLRSRMWILTAHCYQELQRRMPAFV